MNVFHGQFGLVGDIHSGVRACRVAFCVAPNKVWVDKLVVSRNPGWDGFDIFCFHLSLWHHHDVKAVKDSCQWKCLAVYSTRMISDFKLVGGLTVPFVLRWNCYRG